MFKFFSQYFALSTLLLASLEACLFFLLLLALTLLHLGDSGIASITQSLDLVDLALICAAFLLMLTALGIYNRDAVNQFGVLLQRSVIFLFVIVFLGLMAWMVDDLVPNLNLSSYISLFALVTGLNFVAVMTTRLAFLSFPKLDGFKHRVLVLGSGHLGHRIDSYLVGEGDTTLHRVGYISLDELDRPESDGSSGEVGSSVVDLRKLAHDLKADEIVIASREWRGLPVWELLDCKMSGVRITDYLSFWERETGQIDLDEVKPGWLALSDGFRVGLPRRIMKRMFDILLSLIFLTLTFPLLAVTALLIKLESSGPIFYRQKRVGRQGRIFNVIKFRSMYNDAERDGQPKWAKRTDPRITFVGHFIRRSRIDEIPQILNVLLGHMSFVGPRPERPYFVRELHEQIPLYSIRHNVRPGITGWAQVNYPYGASVEDARRKLSYDIYYVKNCGLFLDLVIILQTVRVVLSGDGAR